MHRMRPMNGFIQTIPLKFLVGPSRSLCRRLARTALRGIVRVACLMACLGGWPAGAETVIFKDGRRIEDCNVTFINDLVHIERGGSLVTVPQSAIERIERERESGVAPLDERGQTPPLLRPLAARPPADGGEVRTVRTENGAYCVYVPKGLRTPERLLFLAHGSLEQSSALDEARRVIEAPPWRELAESHGVILVSLAFDGQQFAGYRYLLGEQVGPDAFLLSICETFRQRFPDLESRVLLYGHSAGGQFVHRFALTHPERVAAAVVVAAGSYAFPEREVAWPFGMREAPLEEGFVRAAQLPITVVVGSQDETRLDPAPAQKGHNRIERGQAWVAAMRELADREAFTPRVRFVLLAGLDHTSYRLAPEAAPYLFR